MKTLKSLTIVVLVAMLVVSSAFADHGRGGYGRGGRDCGRSGGSITLGKVLLGAAVVYGLSRVIDRAPCQQQPYYQPQYGGGYGYSNYNVACVVESLGNNRVVVNRAIQPGTQLTALGQWVTDPNTRQPIYRKEIATLVVNQSNGVTSLCDVVRGYCGRGDDIVIAGTPPPAFAPAPASEPLIAPAPAY